MNKELLEAQEKLKEAKAKCLHSSIQYWSCVVHYLKSKVKKEEQIEKIS